MNKIKLFKNFCLLLVGALLITGCNSEEAMLKKIISPADDKFAQEYVEMVRNHDYEKALSLVGSEIRNTVKQADLEQIAGFLDKGEITSVEVIRCNVFQANGEKTVTMGYQYRIGESWVTALVVVKNVNGKQQILGLHVEPIPKSLKESNAFTFTGKSIIHYIYLLVMVAIFILTVFSFILCIRSRIRKKWLWLILVFVGIGQISLNWTTGEILFNFLSINFKLFGVASFKGGLYAPWLMQTIVPVGSIVFLLKRKKMISNYDSLGKK